MDSNVKSSSNTEAVMSEDLNDSDDEINFDDFKDIVDDEDNEGGNNVIVFNCESRVERKNSPDVIEREWSPDCDDSVAKSESPGRENPEIPTSLVRPDLSVNDESMDSSVSNSTVDKKENFKTTKKKGQQPKKKNCMGTSDETKLVSTTRKSKAVESDYLVKKSNVFEPKPDEYKTPFNNFSKRKSKFVELESKIKETKISSPVHQVKVLLERLDLSRYRIGNSDCFSSHPIANSIQDSISAPAKDKNYSNQFEVPHQIEIEKAVLIKTLKSSDKGEQNNLPQIKVKPLKIKNTQKESNCLKEVVNNEELSVVNCENPIKIKQDKRNKRPIVEEVPVFHTKSLISSTKSPNHFTNKSKRDIPPSRSMDSNVGDKEKPTKAFKRRRISDTNISSSVKLKSTPEDLAANRKRLKPATELMNNAVSSIDIVDRPLKIDPKESSKRKTKEVVGNEIPSNAVVLKSSDLLEIEDASFVKEPLVEKVELNFNKSASKKLKSKKVLDDKITNKSLINRQLTESFSLDNKGDNCKENRLEINSNEGETGQSKLKVDLEPHFDFATEASEFLVKDSCDDYKIDLDGVFKILDEDTVEDDEQVIKHLLQELLIKVDRLTVNYGQNFTTRDKPHSIKVAEISAAKVSASISNNILAKSTEEVVPSSLCNSVGESSAIIDGAATKICDSIIKSTTLVSKCERTSKWYHPVVNLTKSERRLRKIKRGHGLSAEFKKRMKFLLKRNRQQYLIEVVQLHKLSEAKILKLSRCKSTSDFQRKPQTQFPRNASVISRPKDTDRTSSQRRSSKGENICAKFREDKSHIGAMKKADSALARRLSNLPRIPKKASAINSNLNTPKISSPALEKVIESKCSSPLSNLKSSLALNSKANDSSRRKPIEDVLLKVVTPKCTRNTLDDNRLVKYASTNLKTGNGWEELELNELIKFGEKHLANPSIAAKLSRINNLVKNNSASSVNKPYNPFCGILDMPTGNNTNIVSIKPNADKPMDVSPTNDKLFPTAYHPDSLSVDPQVSDEGLSVRTHVDDSSISSEEDNISICSRNNVLIVPKSNYWLEKYDVSVLQDTSYFYRYELSESLASSDTVEDLWSDQCEAENKIYNESNKRHSFDQELSKMNLEELEKKMNLSVLADNFKKCLTVFEHIKKKLISDVPILYIEKLFVIARKCINCSQEDTILFLEIVGDCLSPKQNLFEKIKILVALFNWLNTVNRTTKGSHWTAIGRQVGFSNLVSLYNQVLAEGINAKSGSIFGLYRAGSGLHLPMDASIIRALVSCFVSSNMLSACQYVYNLGCQLGVYKCLKIRRWPMVLFVRSYYTVDEIRIILLEFLLKLDKLLSTKFFIDLGVNFNEDLSLFVRFEELKFEDFSVVGINHLTSIPSLLTDVFERFKTALSFMGESILDDATVDQKRTTLRIEKPLLEKLLKYAKVHAQNKITFIDHDKPRLFNALAYQKLTANGIYCQYDENPFI